MKLYVGAGSDRKEGFKHADIVPLDGIDYVFDATQKWPFDDESVGEVFTQDFLEHLPQDKAVFVINEIYRVLKPGGIMEHWFPTAGSYNDLASPSHLSHWNLVTFEFFEEGNRHFEIDKKFNGWVGGGFKYLVREEQNIQNGVSQTSHVVMQKI